jgi:hypothetical protein
MEPGSCRMLCQRTGVDMKSWTGKVEAAFIDGALAREGVITMD